MTRMPTANEMSLPVWIAEESSDAQLCYRKRGRMIIRLEELKKAGLATERDLGEFFKSEEFLRRRNSFGKMQCLPAKLELQPVKTVGWFASDSAREDIHQQSIAKITILCNTASGSSN